MDLNTSLRRLTLTMVGPIGIFFLLASSDTDATGISDNIGKGALLCWPSGSHLPCEMEACTAKKSDIINPLPGIRVPGDERFFGK